MAGDGLLGYFTRHRTAANFVMILMLVLGLSAASRIHSQFFPDVVINTVTVTVDWDGAGPEELDGSVVALMGPALAGVEGVTGTSAVSKEGSATITLTFEPGWDIGRAATNAVLILLTGHAVLGTLRRAARRASFGDADTS